MGILSAVWGKLSISVRKLLYFNAILNEEMNVLVKKTEAMRGIEEDVRLALESLEQRSGKKRKREVDCWLENVQRKKAEVEEREQQIRESRYFWQWQLQKLVKKDVEEVAELFEQGIFPEGLLIDEGDDQSEGEMQKDSQEVLDDQSYGEFDMMVSPVELLELNTLGTDDLSSQDQRQEVVADNPALKPSNPSKSRKYIQNNSLKVADLHLPRLDISVSRQTSGAGLYSSKIRCETGVVEPEPANKETQEEASNFWDLSKKRKTMPKRTVLVKANSDHNSVIDDGYSWRKYGQKDIIGYKYPRDYYRCTYRHTQGCNVTKQVQRSDADPRIFEVTYRGVHTCVDTCSRANQSIPHSSSPQSFLCPDQSVSPISLPGNDSPSNQFVPQLIGWTTGMQLYQIRDFGVAGLRKADTFLPDDIQNLELKCWNIPVDCVLKKGTFAYLQKLVISECNVMYLLRDDFAQQLLHNVRELKVMQCKELEEIMATNVESSDKSNSNNTTIALPNLKNLKLQHLPKLRSIYRGRMTCPSIEAIEVDNCGMLENFPFYEPNSCNVVITGSGKLCDSLRVEAKSVFQPFHGTTGVSGRSPLP